MSRDVEINCPYHRKNETLPIPDSYVCDYKGSITCGDSEQPVTLDIKLKKMRVESVNEAKNLRLPEPEADDTSKQVLVKMQKVLKADKELESKNREIDRLKQILSENNIEVN